MDKGNFTTLAPGDLRWMLIAAVLIRIPVVIFNFPGFPRGWGGEIASVATSLAAGDGFSSPYWASTGPTALVSPVYPFLLSLLFRVFGNHQALAGIVALALGVVASAAICVPTVRLGRQLFDARTALAAGWVWALYPVTGRTDALYIWNTSLFTLALMWLLVAMLGLRREPHFRQSIGVGLLAGFLVVVEAAALSFVILIFAWTLLLRRVSLRPLVVMLLVASLLPGAWMLRNYEAFGEPVFLRSGLGMQLALGTLETESVQRGPSGTLPNRNDAELQRYAALGEPAYIRHRMSEAMAAIRGDPLGYLVNSARRTVAFWLGSPAITEIYWLRGRFELLKLILYALPTVGAVAGLGVLLHRSRPEAWLLILLLLGFSAPFVLTHTEFRYRLPLEPLMLVLCVGAAFAIRDKSPFAATHRKSVQQTT